MGKKDKTQKTRSQRAQGSCSKVAQLGSTQTSNCPCWQEACRLASNCIPNLSKHCRSPAHVPWPHRPPARNSGPRLSPPQGLCPGCFPCLHTYPLPLPQGSLPSPPSPNYAPHSQCGPLSPFTAHHALWSDVSFCNPSIMCSVSSSTSGT